METKPELDSKDPATLKFLYPEAKETGLFNAYPIYTPNNCDIDYHFHDANKDKYSQGNTMDAKVNPNNPWGF